MKDVLFGIIMWIAGGNTVGMATTPPEEIIASEYLRVFVERVWQGQEAEARQMLVDGERLAPLGDEMRAYGEQVQAGAGAFIASLRGWDEIVDVKHLGSQPAPGDEETKMHLFELILKRGEGDTHLPISVVRIRGEYLVAPAARAE